MKKKIKKYGKGGKTNPPIITNDPKDPRLQAYNDSLLNYNNDLSFDKEFAKLVPTFKTLKDKDIQFNLLVKKYPVDIKKGKVTSVTNSKSLAKNKNLGYDFVDNLSFEEPVQPIIYKPKDDWELEARKKAGLQFDNSGMAFAKVKMDSKTGKPIGDVEFISGYNRPKEQPINLPTQTINQLPTQPLQFEEIQRVPFKKGTYFTRERQSQEAGVNGMLDYFDKKTGKLLGTFENGGQNIKEMKKGGIHIKPENKGKFNATKKRTGKTTEELTHSKNPVTKKRAIFAQNAAKWNKKDDGGWNMYSTGFDPTVSQFTPPQNLQELSIQMPDYQLNERKWATPVAPTGMENLTELKDFKSYNTKKPNVSLNSLNMFPLTGNKYLNKGLMYTNQAIKHGMNINNPNPNMSPDYNFKNGGYLPMYQNAGLNLNPANDMHYNWNENISGLPTQSDTFSSQNINPQSFTPIADDTQQNSKNGNFNNIMQGVAAGVNATQGLINFGKGSLDIIGSQLQNKQAQKQEAQLYAQSVYSQAMDTRPQDYIYNRNALAENGKQIKEIGGKGMPNIEIEHKEVVQLPDGFSQEIQGKTHNEGGIPLNLPLGTKIFSEHLKVETPKGKKSYASLAKPFETKKNVDMLESKTADDIQSLTAQMMIERKNQKLNELFALQETDKITGKHGKKVQKEAINENSMMKNGGLKKAGNGKITQIEDPKKYIKNQGKTQYFNYDDVVIPEGTSIVDNEGFVGDKGQVLTYKRGKWYDENGNIINRTNKGQSEDFNNNMKEFYVFHNEQSVPYLPNPLLPISINPINEYSLDEPSASVNNARNRASYVSPFLINGVGSPSEILFNKNTINSNPINNQTNIKNLPSSNKNTSWMQNTFKTKEGKITPKNVDLNKNPLLDWRPFKDEWEKVAGKKFNTTAELQEFAYNWALDNNPQLLKDMWKEFGITNKDEGKYSKYNVDNLSIQDLKDLRGNFIDNIRGRRIFNPKLPVNTQQIPATIPTTQDPVEKIVFKDRVINNTPNVNLDGINIGIPLPNVYSRTPLNYYKVNPNYVDPRYLNVEDQLNQVAQGQRAVQNNLGSRTTADISNILQSQINAYRQNQGIYSNKYNYDAVQDAQAQQFNAQAKTQADQYNQSSWFQQLEDPIRRRESAIGDQQLLDAYKAQERFDKSIAYENTRDLIDATYSQYQNMTPDQIIANLPAKNFENYLLANYQPKKSKSGGKLKIKPSLKKKK